LTAYPAVQDRLTAQEYRHQAIAFKFVRVSLFEEYVCLFTVQSTVSLLRAMRSTKDRSLAYFVDEKHGVPIRSKLVVREVSYAPRGMGARESPYVEHVLQILLQC
jgi:hypothetical protein